MYLYDIYQAPTLNIYSQTTVKRETGYALSTIHYIIIDYSFTDQFAITCTSIVPCLHEINSINVNNRLHFSAVIHTCNSSAYHRSIRLINWFNLIQQFIDSNNSRSTCTLGRVPLYQLFAVTTKCCMGLHMVSTIHIHASRIFN